MIARPQVKKALGWEPKVPLRQGLARMVDDFTKRCAARRARMAGRRRQPSRPPALPPASGARLCRCRCQPAVARSKTELPARGRRT
jgi:hypothetical protein